MSGPRVVMFRHAPVDIDSRVKKFATTLHRAGYEPIIISLEPVGGAQGEFTLGGRIRVIRVPIRPLPQLERPANAVEHRRRLHRQRKVHRSRISGPNLSSAKSLAKWAVTSTRVVVSKTREVAAHLRYAARQHRAVRSGRSDPFLNAGVELHLPVVLDIANTLTDLLVELSPDVLHAHHPQVLMATRDALQRLRAGGKDVKFYYDARENFAGIPDLEKGQRAAHEALVGSERALIGQADAVSTVSEPIAEVLKDTYALRELPSVFLNMPPLAPFGGSVTIREAAGLGPDVPVVLYSGTMSWARGMETIIRGIEFLPADAHLVIVSVPLPHPMIPKLEALAEERGVMHRLHFVGPVSQDELLHYLSGADLAVHPLPGGSPNHDAAMPNKLFEYLHAGLPLVVSDAKLMAGFVRDNSVGRVFASEDPESFGREVGAALGESYGEQVSEVAARYSWQAQEEAIVARYNQLTGFDGHVPSTDEPFGSLDVHAAD